MRSSATNRAVAAVVTTLFVALTPAVATATSRDSCSEPSAAPADIGAQDNRISGLAHLSACSVWEVGYWSDGPGPNSNQKYVAHELVEHWNGQSWRHLTLPTVGSADDNVILLGVSGVATYDLWAVGRRNDNVNDYTVAFHWNGHTWSHISTPRPGTDSKLLDVATHTHSDAWAVGSYSKGPQRRGLIEHWNGHRWMVQTTIASAEFSEVAVTRTGKAWAVGDITRSGKSYGLILHWTGSRWVRQATSLLPVNSTLLAVAARGSNDVWAVGQQAAGSRNFALHYTSGRWHRVPTPNVAADTNAMVAVAPSADGGVWAVSTYEINGVARSHVLVRRSGAWADLGCAPTAPNHLTSVAAAHPGEALVAGFTYSGADSHFVTRLCT